MTKPKPAEIETDIVAVNDDVATNDVTDAIDDVIIDDTVAVVEEDEPVNMTRVRKWAKANNIEVSARGRIGDDVITMYKNRDQTSSTETDVNNEMERDSQPWRPWHDKEPGERNVSRWYRGTDIAWLQKALGVEQTGDFGEETEDAVKRYQQALGMTLDGQVGRRTWGSLRGGNFVTIQTLENGFIHAQRATGVIEVQARLVARGYYDGMAHGLADEATQVAYGRYQEDLGQLANGIPDRLSLEQMGFRVSD